MSKGEIADQEKEKEKEKEKIPFILEGSLKVIQGKTDDTECLQIQIYCVIESLCGGTKVIFFANLSEIIESAMKEQSPHQAVSSSRW